MKRIKITIGKLLVAQEVHEDVYAFMNAIGCGINDNADKNGNVVIELITENDIIVRIVQLYMTDLSKKFGLGQIDVEIN